MREATASVPGIARAGILAGLAGAVLIDIYLLAIYVVLGHAYTMTQFYQFVASGAVGPAAYTAASYAWLGALLHVLVSIGWGIGFAYLATRTPQLIARPAVSGVVYGVVVMLSMWLVEFAAAIWRFPSLASFEHDLVSHTLFFGLPVAFVVARTLRRA